ncbi:hypothetical protein Hanom_Chr12g01076001 [Helianthus anomalus]
MPSTSAEYSFTLPPTKTKCDTLWQNLFIFFEAISRNKAHVSNKPSQSSRVAMYSMNLPAFIWGKFKSC